MALIITIDSFPKSSFPQPNFVLNSILEIRWCIWIESQTLQIYLELFSFKCFNRSFQCPSNCVFHSNLRPLLIKTFNRCRNQILSNESIYWWFFHGKHQNSLFKSPLCTKNGEQILTYVQKGNFMKLLFASLFFQIYRHYKSMFEYKYILQ